jgi:L-methionine (R)-S-oxide reductase
METGVMGPGVRQELERRERYRTIAAQLDELLEPRLDTVAAMATFVAVVHHALEAASWTGFYRLVRPDLLRIGPYQGPVGCLEIELGRGVCGTAAKERRSQLVPDVHLFPGHIACDAASRSEVVVPVFDRGGRLQAVLDLDSHELAAFDGLDVLELEALVTKLAPFFGGAPAGAGIA